MNEELLAIIAAVSDIPIAVVLLYAYHRASKALEDQRRYSHQREERLLGLLEKLCEKDE